MSITCNLERLLTLSSLGLRSQPFLNDGLIKRLLQLIHSGHAKLKLNALWALKNLIFKYTSGRKQAIMNEFGWDEIERHVVAASLVQLKCSLWMQVTLGPGFGSSGASPARLAQFCVL